MMKKILAYLFVTAAFGIQVSGQVKWTKHPDNPVLPKGVSGDWDDVAVGSPTIIYNGTTYQMWYNGSDGSNANIGYATSTDKINWDKHPTPVLEHGPNGSWDDVNTLHPSVYFDGITYHMWYTGVNGSFGQIGYATSPDSINWTKYPGNPVLTLGTSGSWDDQSVNSPDVLFIDGVFHMWYAGFDGSHEQIGHATSLNGIDWEKDTLNPVLKVGDPGSWNNASSTQPSVLYDGTNFHMWYGGGPDFGWRIGYAYSEDGRIWNKVYTNNPVLEPGFGNWDGKYVGYHIVRFNSDSTGFDMWYTGARSTGYVGDIGYATAPWEIPTFKNTWYKYQYNPVFKGMHGEFDSENTYLPSIVVNENKYHMWYSGFGGGAGSRVGYAVSDDGITWESTHKPVLQTGSGDDWDNYSVQGASVLYDGNTWHMWYSGWDGVGDFSFQIGYATSTDKINWTKYENNPVLGQGAGGEWDEVFAGWPEVLLIDGIYHMWYSGRNWSSLNQIGHATSLDGISWEKDPMNPVLNVGTTGAWDDFTVAYPDVYYDGYAFHMWYGGAQNVYGEWKVGYAVSLDGSTWQRVSTEGPVMDLGSAGQWDEQYAASGVEIIIEERVGEDDLLKMWYGGGNATNVGKIGYALSEPFDTVPPASPTGVNAIYISADSVVTISWNKNSEEDIKHYTVYRKHPDPRNNYMIQVSDTFYVDSDPVEGSKYAVSATDIIGNESSRSEEKPVTSVNQSTEAPLKFSLSQNYPNPFNPTTKISYQIPTAGLVTLRVFNLLGEVVATLVNEEKPVGTFELNWNAESLSSGVYFYKLKAGNFVETKKMLLLK